MPVQPAFNSTRVRVFYDGTQQVANLKALATAVGYPPDQSHHNHSPVPTQSVQPGASAPASTPSLVQHASQAWTVKSATEAARIAGVLRNLGFTDIRITPAE